MELDYKKKPCKFKFNVLSTNRGNTSKKFPL